MTVSKLFPLARMTSATTGTGNTITLGSAYAGFLTFAQAGLADGDTFDYSILDSGTSPTASEEGTGVYTASGTTFVRTVEKSTNSNANLNLSGQQHIIISPRPASFRGRLVQSNVYTTTQTITIPHGATAAKIRMVAGGGGYGSSTHPTGGATTLASGTETITTLTCNGGLGADTNSSGNTGVGGAISTNGDFNLVGGGGYANAGATLVISPGTPLGPTQFGGGTDMKYGVGAANTSFATYCAAGSGSYLEKYLSGLTSGNTLALTVGAGGVGSGAPAGTGGAGVCLIDWYT